MPTRQKRTCFRSIPVRLNLQPFPLLPFDNSGHAHRLRAQYNSSSPRYSFSAASFRNAAFPSFRVSTIDFIPAMIAPLSFDARAFDMIH